MSASERQAPPRRPRSRRAPEVGFALVSPTEPGNVGAAARTLAAFGFGELCILAPARPIEALDEALAARGGRALLARVGRIERDGVDAYLGGFDEIWGTTARSGRQRRLVAAAEAVAEAFERPRGRLLILFGPERDGLDRAWLDRCHKLIRIPTRGGPLNLAHAVTVIAYEFRRMEGLGGDAAGESGAARAAEASAAQRREILTRTGALLGELAYPTRSLRRHPPEAFLEPLRSGPLSRRQARWLLGLLARLERRVGAPSR